MDFYSFGWSYARRAYLRQLWAFEVRLRWRRWGVWGWMLTTLTCVPRDGSTFENGKLLKSFSGGGGPQEEEVGSARDGG